MDHQPASRVERAAGLLLLAGVVASVIGAVMFSLRGGDGGLPPSPAYYVWERGFFLAAVPLTAVGFVLLADHPNLGAGRMLARAGASAYLFGGIVGVVAETLGLAGAAGGVYPLIVGYVVLAFLAQAAIGGGLRQGDLLASWIGRTTIVWNLGALVTLVVLTPYDVYYPVSHHVVPLLIGVALLWRTTVPRPSPRQTEAWTLRHNHEVAAGNSKPRPVDATAGRARVSAVVPGGDGHRRGRHGRAGAAPVRTGRADRAVTGRRRAGALCAVGVTTIGTVMASRRPCHPVSWLLLTFGLCLGAAGVTVAYATNGAIQAGAAGPMRLRATRRRSS